MDWIFVVISGLFEVLAVCGTRMLSMKRYISGGFITILFFGLALYFLHLGMRTLDMSVAYAAYTGIGVVGTVVCGVVFWGESRKKAKFIYITILIGAIIALKIGG